MRCLPSNSGEISLFVQLRLKADGKGRGAARVYGRCVAAFDEKGAEHADEADEEEELDEPKHGWQPLLLLPYNVRQCAGPRDHAVQAQAGLMDQRGLLLGGGGDGFAQAEGRPRRHCSIAGQRMYGCRRADAGELHIVKVIQREVIGLAGQGDGSSRCCAGAHALMYGDANQDRCAKIRWGDLCSSAVWLFYHLGR